MGYNTVFLTGQALNADFKSRPLQVLDGRVYATQLTFTGSTCEFTASLEVSSEAYNNDPDFVPTQWDPLDGSEKSFTEAGSHTYNIGQVGYVWVRLSVTDDSAGSNNGEISGTINVKN